MLGRAGSQLFRGAKPIFLRRSFGAAAGLPEGMGQRRDFIVSKGCDAMTGHRLRHLVGLFGMLEGLPGMLVSGLMLRLPLVFTGAMGVRGEIVQLRGALMIFVMGAVIIARGHTQRVTIWPDFVWASLASL